MSKTVKVRFGQGGQYLGPDGSLGRTVRMNFKDFERMIKEVPKRKRSIECAINYGGTLCR